MSIEIYPTANSHTRIAYDTNWLVLDIGSGHSPHRRADVLIDKFLSDDYERSGQSIKLLPQKYFIVADACAMPFRDKAFDFIVCSHVAEHIKNVDDFCLELNRVGRKGYLETPSKFAETLRHVPTHRWFVSNRRGKLIFEPTPNKYPLGWFGKLFFSIYFYQNLQAEGRDVFGFAHGCGSPWHQLIKLVRRVIAKLWVRLKFLTYTRLLWKKEFHWEIRHS